MSDTSDQNIFTRIYQHLLPRARTFFFWQDSTTQRFKSQLRQFFEGLSGLPGDARSFLDDRWDDVRPTTTTQLDEWEEQFALPNSGLSEAQRRTRLDAAWEAVGGQSPRYLQDIVQASGFDVFVHDWWELPVVGAPVARDPREFLTAGGPQLAVLCGEPEALCGEDGSATSPPIVAPVVCGQTNDPLGYQLVNKIRTSETLFLGCGDPEMLCSDRGPEQDPVENFAFAGQPLSITFGEVAYPLPDDPDRWRFFLYFGAETFPDQAQVAGLRRDEFEDLILKLSPGQEWLGVLVDYV